MFNQPRLMAGFYSDSAKGTREALEKVAEFASNKVTFDIPTEKNKWTRLKLIVSSLLSRMPYTIKWLESENVFQTLNQLTADNEYDLIHFDTVSLDPFYSAILAGKNKSTIVMDHHNIESHMMTRRAQKEENLLKRIYFKWEAIKLTKYEQTELNKYHAHVTCSDDDTKRLTQLVPNALIRTIPNGISLSDVSRDYAPKDNTILFVGGLSWYPNLEGVQFIIEQVIPLLKANNVRFHFKVIGEGASEKIKEKYRDTPEVQFLGFVDSLVEHYSSASVIVAPIFDGGGTKLKVLDALANNVPLVTTTLGCEGIKLTHEKNCLIADTATQIASNVQRIFEDERLGQELTKNGYQIIEEQYSYEKVGEQLCNFYKNLIATKSGQPAVDTNLET
ncbi:glycosyltransferase family 4 protein [Oleiphilus sp. HI0079]|uniref:glycosyltransferase family 4 protein n=3 Tax=Oleiphilus sp. HI0079 TaxID=1822254 RepID=UPI0018D31D4E|nr:glycosyltransferase family 4 protein [Oleiphilus sp. HI0079]